MAYINKKIVGNACVTQLTWTIRMVKWLRTEWRMQLYSIQKAFSTGKST